MQILDFIPDDGKTATDIKARVAVGPCNSGRTFLKDSKKIISVDGSCAKSGKKCVDRWRYNYEWDTMSDDTVNVFDGCKFHSRLFRHN